MVYCIDVLIIVLLDITPASPISRPILPSSEGILPYPLQKNRYNNMSISFCTFHSGSKPIRLKIHIVSNRIWVLQADTFLSVSSVLLKKQLLHRKELTVPRSYTDLNTALLSLSDIPPSYIFVLSIKMK